MIQQYISFVLVMTHTSTVESSSVLNLAKSTFVDDLA